MLAKEDIEKEAEVLVKNLLDKNDIEAGNSNSNANDSSKLSIQQ